MKQALLFTSIFWTHLTLAINSQSYFKNTIQDYKKDITAKAAFLKKDDPSIDFGAEYISPQSTDLALQPNNTASDTTSYPSFINYLTIPSEQKKNVIVIQSGVHGIEGLAGAGVQNFLLDYFQGKKFKTTTLMYIHMVNPWGSHFFRRTNPANVDLNRNFVYSESDFRQNNEDYGKIQSFLNPTSAYEYGFFKKMTYFFDAFLLIYKYSVDTLRRSILKGQYSYPKGLYFGGHEYQPEMKALKNIWDSKIQGYEKVVYIDLHTGYGEKGKMHLLAGNSGTEAAKRLSALFEPAAIDFGDAKNFYQTTGDVLSYYNHHYKANNEIYPITFEYGTLNSQTTFGSLESLYRMRSENQSFHDKTTSPESKQHVEKLFREMFYPSDFQWRDSILVQTKNEMDKILKRLGE